MAADPQDAASAREVAELKREVSTLQDRITELQQRPRVLPQAIEALGLDTPMGRRQAMLAGLFSGTVSLGAIAALSEPSRADAVAADVGTEADPWQKGWMHEIESGDGANALEFGDAVAFDHEAVSSATTIGNVTVVVYDSSVAGFTLTIPSSLEQNGMVVRFIDQSGSAATNNVTVENSSNTTIATIDADDTIFEVWWDGSEWLNGIFTERVDTRVASIAQVGAEIRQTSAQTISSGSTTDLAFDSTKFEDSDVATADLASDRITLDVAGTWLIVGRCRFNDPGDGTRIFGQIQVNGGTEDNNEVVASAASQFPGVQVVTTQVVSSPSDNVTMRVLQDSGSDQNTQGNGNGVNLKAVRLG